MIVKKRKVVNSLRALSQTAIGLMLAHCVIFFPVCHLMKPWGSIIILKLLINYRTYQTCSFVISIEPWNTLIIKSLFTTLLYFAEKIYLPIPDLELFALVRPIVITTNILQARSPCVVCVLVVLTCCFWIANGIYIAWLTLASIFC